MLCGEEINNWEQAFACSQFRIYISIDILLKLMLNTSIINVVYFELLRRSYDVAIGKVDQAEVDFIATKAENPGIGFRRSQGSFIYWWLCLCAQKLSSSAPLRCSRCRPATSHRCRCPMRHSRHRRRRCCWCSWNPGGSYKIPRRRSSRWGWNCTSTP